MPQHEDATRNALLFLLTQAKISNPEVTAQVKEISAALDEAAGPAEPAAAVTPAEVKDMIAAALEAAEAARPAAEPEPEPEPAAHSKTEHLKTSQRFKKN
jgi:hypothetical protein